MSTIFQEIKKIFLMKTWEMYKWKLQLLRIKNHRKKAQFKQRLSNKCNSQYFQNKMQLSLDIHAYLVKIFIC